MADTRINPTRSRFFALTGYECALRQAKLNGDIPTMAELWAELDAINQEHPLELELPERINR